MSDHLKDPSKPASWASFNGYGVLIAFLALLSATGSLTSPPGWTFTLASDVGFAIAGAGLLYSYVARRVDIEVFASILLVIANGLDLYIEARATSPFTFDWRGAAIQIALIIAVTARATALLHGGVYAIPEWRRPEGRR